MDINAIKKRLTQLTSQTNKTFYNKMSSHAFIIAPLSILITKYAKLLCSYLFTNTDLIIVWYLL